jgi:hypothetical protein
LQDIELAAQKYTGHSGFARHRRLAAVR